MFNVFWAFTDRRIKSIMNKLGVLNNFPYLRGESEFELGFCEVHFFIKSNHRFFSALQFLYSNKKRMVYLYCQNWTGFYCHMFVRG